VTRDLAPSAISASIALYLWQEREREKKEGKRMNEKRKN
jgi:hypothetical protein